jgi:hypothetical protein
MPVARGLAAGGRPPGRGEAEAAAGWIASVRWQTDSHTTRPTESHFAYMSARKPPFGHSFAVSPRARDHPFYG